MFKIDNPRRGFFWIGWLTAIFFLPQSAFAQCGSTGSRTLSTTGEASIMIRPDIAYFPLDITTTAPIIDDAYNENSVKIENTIKKLKELGITRDLIKIMDPKLFRIDQYNASESPIFGISNVVLITWPGIDKMKPEELRKKIFAINQSLSRVTVSAYASSPGAGQINNEMSRCTGGYNPYPTAVFGYTKYSTLEEQILTDALTDARQQAEHQAKIIGVAIKDIIYFTQTYPYANNYGGYGNQESILPEGPLSGDPLKLKIYATVSVTYTFE
jgi:uncharacterized protein YggE